MHSYRYLIYLCPLQDTWEFGYSKAPLIFLLVACSYFHTSCSPNNKWWKLGNENACLMVLTFFLLQMQYLNSRKLRKKMQPWELNSSCGWVIRDFEREEKLGVTFNSDKLGGIDFTKFSKLAMCSARNLVWKKKIC